MIGYNQVRATKELASAWLDLCCRLLSFYFSTLPSLQVDVFNIKIVIIIFIVNCIELNCIEIVIIIFIVNCILFTFSSETSSVFRLLYFLFFVVLFQVFLLDFLLCLFV